ncbi:nucleotidyltransferase family protein [Winogradskyella helgolandensis]|uniref:nucleotidyltransferase family protein n=1 Tax=Winogradskyella helgolandensis TaxID=2697010 RepID=UPI0015CBD525|nr:nucleotidyltransferase family protein [Winogradskyella helgolandensis]
MNNLATTYKHIGAILSFEFPNVKLEQTLSGPSFNWDPIVIIGSQHLVLPTIYCRLKSKQLLHLLPEDLISYLKYITDENRKRNIVILAQIEELTNLFNLHSIDHLYLKGAALLASGFYKDIAERMLGDIDILVKNEHLSKAFDLLTNSEYKYKAMTFGKGFFEHKHLPRLETKVTNTRIAAVEIHRKLFDSYRHPELVPNSIFHNQRQKKSIFIPSPKHLLMHNILNHQINDDGAHYNNISFRSIYDTLLLLQEFSETSTFNNRNIFKRYFKYSSLFFNEIRTVTKVKPDLYTSFYMFKLKHSKVHKFWNKLLRLGYYAPILLKRFWFFVSNRAYRKAIIQDKRRVINLFTSILRKI